jgi:hypothetical protein
MCDIFIMCFVLFLLVTCFGWNFNDMAAAAALGKVCMADAAAAAARVVVGREEEGELFGCNDD